MRFTRRRLERGAAVIAAAACIAGAVASCSSSEEPQDRKERRDAASDGTSPPPPPTAEAGLDARPRDAAPFDGGALPVVCTSQPCAKALVTTLPDEATGDRSEGYCARLDDGTVACWGGNSVGQLGRGDADVGDSPTAARVIGLSRIVGLDHTCAVDASGSVFCWGRGPFLRNDAGQATTERAPIALTLPPVKRVAVGSQVGCADVEGALLCWGRNDRQQMGPTPGLYQTPSPITLPPGSAIRTLAIGDATFVIREDGEALSWGANPPLARVSSLPIDPYPLPITLGGVSSLDLTTDSGCLTTGGVGYCWGRVDTETAPGPLFRALPEPIVAPEPLVQIATTRMVFITDFGGRQVVQPQRWCAVAASGAIYCWGYNASGQAGTGTKDYVVDAAKVPLPGPAVEVRTMPLSTCALLASGKVHCWGNNYYGQLGNRQNKGISLTPEEVILP